MENWCLRLKDKIFYALTNIFVFSFDKPFEIWDTDFSKKSTTNIGVGVNFMEIFVPGGFSKKF
jgi:hypothetical protein